MYHKGMHFPLKKTCPETWQITPETPFVTSDVTMIDNNKLRRKYKEVVRAYFKIYSYISICFDGLKKNYENMSMAPVSALFPGLEADTYLHLVRM